VRDPSRPRIALTSGEPAGIGPELCAIVAARVAESARAPCELIVLGDQNLLRERSGACGITPGWEHAAGVRILPIPTAARVQAGRLNAANAAHVIQQLDRAASGALGGEFDAIVTAPVQKSIINDAGIAFRGHTEFFAERCGTTRPVMMLVAGSLRVALATTHLPLREVSAALSEPLLTEVLGILHRELRAAWGIARPRIGVCGLNPHAGESGHLGDEEIRYIAPAIRTLREQNADVTGPLGADTIFLPESLRRFDVVLAMYHDQGLPVLKHAGFGRAVNVTLGLPIIRTSVDHGTALEVAGTGRADPGSLSAALELAIELVAQRRR
jgi:4-hydroxythreonine-4-phosphate dehydrogenase